MCKRDDPFVTYLKSFGYNAVRLPRANIRPLQLLVRHRNELAWLGDLTDVFLAPTGAKLPAVNADVQAPSISGRRTGELSVGMGLSILGGIITSLGGSKLGLDAAYKSARTAVFEFPDVQTDVAPTTQLDQFIAQSDVNPNSRAVGQMLEADSVYVVTDTIKSRKFAFEAKQRGGASVSINVPVLQDAIGGSVTVSGDATADSKIVYQGATPLIFGFKAVQLFFEGGVYTTSRPAAPLLPARALNVRGANDEHELLVTEHTLLSL